MRWLREARVPAWKRWLDVGLILLVGPFIALALALVATMIKLVSKGPVLFRQERVGLGGRRFTCLKFRTMHQGVSTATHENHLADLMRSGRPMTKLDGHDPRLIPFAWVLRSTGLDELPQLFNVLRGEMSLVGPRPCTPSEYEDYTPAERARLRTLPGLTGLWQVNGKNHTTFAQMIELDLRYIQAQCVWLDLGIMLRTPVVLCEQALESAVFRKLKPPEVVVPLMNPAPARAFTGRSSRAASQAASQGRRTCHETACSFEI